MSQYVTVETCENKPLGAWVFATRDAAIARALRCIEENEPDSDSQLDDARQYFADGESHYEEGDYTISVLTTSG